MLAALDKEGAIPAEQCSQSRVRLGKAKEAVSEEGRMGFGRGALLWLIGVPLPIIILIALFWHH